MQRPPAIEVHNARLSKRNTDYADYLYSRLQRKGFLFRDCQRLANTDRNAFGACMVALGDADAVFELLKYHLLRLGAHRAQSLVFVADGAKWIWRRTRGLREALGLDEHAFHEVVDYFHVVERLAELSKTQLRWGEKGRLRWFHEQKRRLKAGEIEAIEDVVRVIGTRKDADMETEADYWDRNRERLRYAAFRAQGHPVGSGAVESAVRRVVNLRMKGASITWTEEHAEGILHLRSHAKSERWSELEDAVLDITGWRPSARNPRRVA